MGGGGGVEKKLIVWYRRWSVLLVCRFLEVHDNDLVVVVDDG